ncbi:hypothetical protein BpHYR1_038938 [Brachionus plicatilis]|uniref:Uncharacterized protein n=1 Tax=Brachionus plicatilis TaxID=10195 RepID=A0A3M7PLT4_BRAPC|nr:hypothetical protein BpHYR1_038938 [Brachionus plicatilis]
MRPVIWKRTVLERPVFSDGLDRPSWIVRFQMTGPIKHKKFLVIYYFIPVRDRRSGPIQKTVHLDGPDSLTRPKQTCLTGARPDTNTI